MLVVSDSSPLNFLVRLHCTDILPKLFQTVAIPPEVPDELSQPATPSEVRMFVAGRPAWLQVRAPLVIEHIPKLHAGEAAAISLARELNADIILLDDAEARNEASRRGLTVTGLPGILERAALAGLVNFADVARRFPADYRIDPALVKEALARVLSRGEQ